ncbi:MAG: DNA circularization N-terminal domain-containing protein [Hyphomicrobiaceae bacterium]
MSWKDSLRPASFRGAAFHMDDRSHETGRRIHNHEYPKRDANFAEDMGRKTRTWSVNAYVIGEDYMAQRDRLLAVCERQGPGTYSDRWRGSQSAVCETITLVETEHDGRYCKFAIKFIAAGSQPSALGIASAAAQAIGAAAALSGAALASFASTAVVAQLIDPRRLGELGEATASLGSDRTQARGVDGATVWLGKVQQR